jgi:hypothetical protein
MTGIYRRSLRRRGRWMAVAAAAGALVLQGCVGGYLGYVYYDGPFKDNPLDQGIAKGFRDHEVATADKLLNEKLPAGTPIAEARRYLENIGAKCPDPASPRHAVVCTYSQYLDAFLVTPGSWYEKDTTQYLSSRRYDFRIDLAGDNGTLRYARVAMNVVRASRIEVCNKRRAQPVPLLDCYRVVRSWRESPAYEWDEWHLPKSLD